LEDKKKILIVDDEKMNIMALAHFLKPQYEIVIASDGTSALSEAEKHNPDIILLDILMPDMSGFDVLVNLKDSTKTMNIPVIFLTGLDNAEDEEKGLMLGAVDYITKPFNQSIVRARISTHLKMSNYIRTIEKLCMLDALTGLSNRRGFDMRFEAEWGRAFREKKPLGIIMLDIDNFKKYNDTFGHPQGDVLIQAISEVMNSTVNRSSDFSARWGGEEFLALLPDTDLSGTIKKAEQLRIKTTEIKLQAGEIKLTDGAQVNAGSGGWENPNASISLGASSKIPVEGDNPADFLNEVDKLLYTAKKNGKNQVCSS